MGMISRWIDAQDDEVLGRLARVPDDKWTMHNLVRGEYGCVLGHGLGMVERGSCATPILTSEHTRVGTRFDDLCWRFGDARIGHLVSERARRVLEERRLDEWRNRPKGVSEQEAVTYFRTHVSLNCEPVEVGA